MSEIITFTYDNQGNMLSEGDKKYSYDSFGRQVKVEIPTVVNAGKSNISSLQECQVQINRYEKVCAMSWKRMELWSNFCSMKTER